MTRILALLLLSACTAQANEPELKLSQVHAIENFVDQCEGDELACQLRCDNTFVKLEHELHWAVCSDLVARKFGGKA